MTAPGVPPVALNDGTDIPAIGFGTYGVKGDRGRETIVAALRNGYRLLDSAVGYENEEQVGEAVRRSGIPRDEIRVTSKLPGRHHRHDLAIGSVESSLRRTGLDHLDLYLIHWPNPSQDLYVEAWAALAEARSRGLVRSIGVSNFLPEHIDRLIRETGVVPAVNQIELHPYLPQTEQRTYDDAHGIVTEAWSPLGRDRRLLDDPAITAVAGRTGHTPAQVVLRWEMQIGTVPLPKSSTPSRQVENLSAAQMELSAEDMADIAALARADGRLWGQDPRVYEES